MTKQDKIAAMVVSAIGIIVLAWIMYMRRTTSSAPVSPYSPGTIGQAYPGTSPWQIAANGLPSVGATSDSGSGCCGCSSGSSGIFNSMTNMLQYFQSKSSKMFDNYQASVYAAYPDSVTQYFNNPVGASESRTSMAIMRE